MAQNEQSSAGEGGELTGIDLTVEKDRALLRRAVKERWPMPMEKREKLAARLLDVALDEKSDTRAIASVARTLASMDKLNQADEHADRDYERIDSGKATERVDVICIKNDLV